jgi:hypothetical protein
MGKKILFKFILPPIAKDINMLKNISIFKEINIISKQIEDVENHESNYSNSIPFTNFSSNDILENHESNYFNYIPFTSFSSNDVLIFSKYIRIITSFIEIKVFCKFLESLNFITNTFNGKYLTLQIYKFFILGIRTYRRIQNPKHLTPAEKEKAKVNEYEEFPAEIQQKIPQRIEFLNPDNSNSIILEEVLQTSAKFLGNNSNYPFHTQILLDNLTRDFIKKYKDFHIKSMKALEYHLICNEILLQSIASNNNQPAENIINRARSPTEIYQIQRISLKEMGKAHQKDFDPPGKIQNLIFHNPSYTEYFDKWIQRMMIFANRKDIEYPKHHPSPSPFNIFLSELYFFIHLSISRIMSWNHNFFSPYIPQCSYDNMITKVTKLCTNQFLASNLLETLSQLSDEESVLQGYSRNYYQQLSDDEKEDESVLQGYSWDHYPDLE